MKPLTKAEIAVMNILWGHEKALSVYEIIAEYPDPKPAYSTVSTFLKILEAKGYVSHRKRANEVRTFCFSPTMSRDKYIKDVVNDVKDTLFGNSAKKLFSFLVQNEDLSEDEIVAQLEMIKGNTHN